MKLLNEDYLLLEDMKSLETINEEIEEYLIEKYELENLQEWYKRGKAVWKKDDNGHYVDTTGQAIDDEGYIIDPKTGKRKLTGGKPQKSSTGRDVAFDTNMGNSVSRRMDRVINGDNDKKGRRASKSVPAIFDADKAYLDDKTGVTVGSRTMTRKQIMTRYLKNAELNKKRGEEVSAAKKAKKQLRGQLIDSARGSGQGFWEARRNAKKYLADLALGRRTPVASSASENEYVTRMRAADKLNSEMDDDRSAIEKEYKRQMKQHKKTRKAAVKNAEKTIS